MSDRLVCANIYVSYNILNILRSHRIIPEMLSGGKVTEVTHTYLREVSDKDMDNLLQIEKYRKIYEEEDREIEKIKEKERLRINNSLWHKILIFLRLVKDE